MFKLLQNVSDVKRGLRDFGGLLMGLAGAGTIYQDVVFSPDTDLLVKLSLAGAGAVVSLVGWLAPTPPDRWRNHWTRPMTEDDVGHMFGVLSSFGPTSPLVKKLAILNKNLRCFLAIEREEADVRRVVGYFVAYRLTRAAVRRIRAGELTGPTISPKDIVPARWKAYGLYISFLYGIDNAAKAAALRAAFNEVRTLLKKQDPLPIFGRVGTPDSFRLMKKYNFAPRHANKLTIHGDAVREMRAADLTTD